MGTDAPLAPPSTAALRRGRWAVTAMFLVNGAALGAWVARIPVVQEDLALSERALGTALLGLSLGVVVALPVAGGVVARVGARRVTTAGLVTIALGLPLTALAGSRWPLFAALALLGVGMSVMDVAMNAQGVAVERRLGHRVMVSFHGAWSIGGLAGTGLGGLTIAAGATTTAHLAVSGAVILAVGAAAVVVGRAAETERRRTPGPALALPRGALVPLGVVAASSAMGEGAVADWGGVYLKDVVGTSAAVASLGFVVFSLTMAAMRFAGDAAATRFGPAGVVRAGGALAAGGFALALVVPIVPVALLGFALAGVGLASVVPLAFATAGTVDGFAESEAVAAVATVGYSGLLAGPPLIGFLADAITLAGALGVVAALIATMTVTGRALAAR